MSGRAYVSILALLAIDLLHTVLGPPDLGALIPIVGTLVIFGVSK